jgi:hypothetical protein
MPTDPEYGQTSRENYLNAPQPVPPGPPEPAPIVSAATKRMLADRVERYAGRTA